MPQFAGALATAVDVVRAAAGGGGGPGAAGACPVELLRKESLAGLQPAAAAKVGAGGHTGSARATSP